MKEYSGAVFFIDILGVGALTKGEIRISDVDYSAHRFKFQDKHSQHHFCAKILLKFRRVLIGLTAINKGIKVAQLSDCAFIWSENPNLVVNAARELMWECILAGILCRGGLAYGQIVEPDKINTKLGMFICGGAATEAVQLESSGKGARVFINTELPGKLSSIPSDAFTPRKSLIDFSIVDEFLWYRYPDRITSRLDYIPVNPLPALHKIAKAIAMLQYSPKFLWNSASQHGLLHLACTIEVMSKETEYFCKNLGLKFECENIMVGCKDRIKERYKERSEDICKKIFNSFKQTITKKLEANI
ncbi:hypothetical protein [Agaribacterium sp. ZY112]|uniref:hypothetical protein n=1 Tax=Agaribacterium sp. ZY112 TaxID=3233574 RepID=UPI003524BB83